MTDNDTDETDDVESRSKHGIVGGTEFVEKLRGSDQEDEGDE